MGHNRTKLLYFVTEDWYFWSHRVQLARFMRDLGYAVQVGTRFTTHRAAIEALDLDCVEVPFERSLRSPFRDIFAAYSIDRLIRHSRPQIVHLVALKPVILAAPAIRLNPDVQFVLAITGLGYLFSTKDRGVGMLRAFVALILRALTNLPNTRLLLQNEDDCKLLSNFGIGVDERIDIIPGSGVDVTAFRPPEGSREERDLIVLPARMLRDKGVVEFVEAASIIKRLRPRTRLVLVGGCDPDNRASITRTQIEAWVQSGVIEWWGHRDDMVAVYRQATIVCLPSYREGLPKALLEAAACGRPLVATNVPGCRAVCRQGETGLLIEPQNSTALANTIMLLLENRGMRENFSRNARALVLSEFSNDVIHRQTQAFYESLPIGPVR